MKTLNIGIVAHVDAGKTSLTERILYETHVITEIGKVDQGNTQTDSLELERRRGITIKASVVSFFVQDVKINLIDTPGHADFIAEVERSFGVLDGAILVLSAVEGVQAQTKVLMSVLRRLGIPTILFVNKIDRGGAQGETLIETIKEKLTEQVIPFYSVTNDGTKQAGIVRRDDAAFLDSCLELVASNDEAILEAYVNDEPFSEEQVRALLIQQIQHAKIYPVFFGSAMTGIGVPELLDGIVQLFPITEGKEDAPLSGVVFKLEKETSGEKVAYVRLFSGCLVVRTHVPLSRRARDMNTHLEKVKKLHIFVDGHTEQVQRVGAGEFCKLWGLEDVKIGDIVGEWSEAIREVHFAEPQLETRIEAVPKKKNILLYRALIELAEEDPLIHVIRDELHNITYLRIFGEVQKEVIEAMLQEQYGLTVQFSETGVVCIEKPVGVGQGLEVMGEGENLFYATVGIRIEPGAPGSGITYRLEVKLGALPLAFHRAIEETVFETLRQGLYGWEVTDVVVVLTHTGYASPISTAGDFRKVTPLVLMEALRQAGTAVYEPVLQFELNAPTETISTVMFRLASLRATFEQPELRREQFLLKGCMPVATAETLKRELHALTKGEGVFITQPVGFSKLEGEYPTRPRLDWNPLNRKDYMLHVLHAY